MKKPTIIAIEGNIGTGKSTLLHYLEKQIITKSSFSSIIILTEPIDEWIKIKDTNGDSILTKFYNDPKKYSFAFQILVLKSMNELIVKTILENPECKIILCERSILSSHHVFTEMLYKDNIMNEIEHQLYQDIYHMWCINEIIPDMIIYLYATPEKCLDRVKKRNREGEQDISLHYLQKCNDYYDEFITLLLKENNNENNKKDIKINEKNIIVYKMNVEFDNDYDDDKKNIPEILAILFSSISL